MVSNLQESFTPRSLTIVHGNELYTQQSEKNKGGLWSMALNMRKIARTTLGTFYIRMTAVQLKPALMGWTAFATPLLKIIWQ